MTALLFYATLAIVVSFTCSLLEAFILSVRPSYLNINKKKGVKSAILVCKLQDKLERSLTAILSVNTTANMLGAAGVGSEVQRLYGNSYVTVFSIILTLIILIFSEVIPKTLGARKWRSFVPFAGYLIQGMIYLTWPLIIIIEKMKNGKDFPNHPLSREEVIETAEMGASEGSLEEKESLVIKNLLCLNNIPVSEIMTPRTVVYAFEEDRTISEILTSTKHKTIRFSRIPVYKDKIDNITGVVHRYKILEASSQDLHDLTLKQLIKPIHSVPESISVSAAIDQFLKRKEHLFSVVDSYGVLSGIVTLEDAIETLLGVEIVDEYDSVADMRALALDKWKKLKEERKNRY